MTLRPWLIFAATFVAGAAIALVIRTVTFDPQADAAPAATSDSSALSAAAAASEHAHHAPAAPSAAKEEPPVNTVCAMCGMDVDPSLPTAEYQGQRIGFGCRACPPRFRADPDRYGPYYLRNEVMPR